MTRLSLPCLLLLSLCLNGLTSAEDAAPAVERLTKSYYPKFFLTSTPDGSRLLYSRHYDNRRAANKILMGLRIVNADGTDDRPLMPQFDAQVQIQEHPTISPDGKRLYFTGGGNDTGNASKDIFVCELADDFQVASLKKLAENGPLIGEQPGLSPDGRELVATDVSHNLWVVGSDGKDRKKLIQSAGNYCFQQAWSPDGEWIAFASDRDGNIELYKIRRDGTALTRLTDDAGVDCRPKWSPDARWLAFVSNRSGNEEIYVMRGDGTEIRNLTQNSAVDDHPAWSPDGKRLSFVSLRDGGFDLYRLVVPVDLQITSKPIITPPSSPAETGDLVAAFNFDKDAGTQIKDQAGKNTLQLFNAQLVQRDGRGFVRFDGAKSTAACGNGSGLHLAGPMTISLWIRLAAASGNGYVISKHGYNIYVGPNRIPRFESRSAADNAWVTLPAKDALTIGEWMHVVAVFSAEEQVMRLYLDGKPTGELSRTDGKLGAVEGHPLEFGHYVASKSQFFSGDLDEIRLYRTALAEQEVLELHESQRRLVGVAE